MSKLIELTDAMERPVTTAHALGVLARCWNRAHQRVLDEPNASAEHLEEVRALAFSMDIIKEFPYDSDLELIRALIRRRF